LQQISKRKQPVKISTHLRQYLQTHGRGINLPIQYPHLNNFSDSIALYDKKGKDTLWETCLYPQSDTEQIHYDLLKIYALLKTGGDVNILEHLAVERIDYCLFGNSMPFRIRIINKLNDNFDYFYVKNADASRIYGLELEHLLSPNRISYLVSGDTLIEEHIVGVPGDDFLKLYFNKENFNAIRLAKEFVKFNERCFIRLLGDMHSSNFVIQVIPDFEEIHYRIRAIDFDQQSHEGRKNVYLPQFYKQNKDYLELATQCLSKESIYQYQREERSVMVARLKAARWPMFNLLNAMSKDPISTHQNIEKLKNELAIHYKNQRFLKAKNMADILKTCLLQLFK
jgi:hypothetical protein